MDAKREIKDAEKEVAAAEKVRCLSPPSHPSTPLAEPRTASNTTIGVPGSPLSVHCPLSLHPY